MNALKTIQQENNRLDCKLSGENRKILTDMVVYLHGSSLHSYDIEVIRKELIGMAMETDLRNEKFGDVVGEDYKRFCDQLMENGRKMTAYDKLLENSHILLGGFGFLLLLEILTGPTMKGILASLNFVMPVTLGFVLSTAGATIAAYALYSYVTRHSFELSPGKVRMRSMLLVACFVLVFALITLCRHILGGIVLASIHCLIPLGAIAALFVIVMMLEKKRVDRLASQHETA